MQDCLDAERRQPLLPELSSFLGATQELFASEAVVDQFELLLAKFGGVREKERWHNLLPRIRVVPAGGEEMISTLLNRLPATASVSDVSFGNLIPTSFMI